MLDVLARRLSAAADLSECDLAALSDAVEHVRVIPPRSVLIDEGDRPEHVHVVLAGFACRYKTLPDGKRQIMAWLVPGDFCDLHVAVLGHMDHTVATVSSSQIGRISQEQVDQLVNTSPRLSRALWWASLAQEAILREWLVSVGQQDAERRAAHFFCELHARLDAVGLVQGKAIGFPLTQGELADTLGLSAVHVNRIIQSLRERQWIDWSAKRVVFNHLEQLQEFAQFDANYLHLRRRSRGPRMDNSLLHDDRRGRVLPAG